MSKVRKTKDPLKKNESSNKNTDHDKRDKELFEAFCDDLISICHPDLYEKLDFSKRTSLQQEFSLTRGMKSSLRKVDLLIDVPFKNPDEINVYDLFLDNEDDLIKGRHTISPTETKGSKRGRRSKNEKLGLEGSLKQVKKKTKFLIHLELERSDNPFEMCERMLEYESLIKIEYKDSFVCPIIIFFVQDIKGIYRSVLKTIAIHDEMSSFRYFRIGLKGESADFWLKEKHPLMFALAMYMQYNQKERAKMKVSILKTIAESDISTEQKIMLDEYIEQAFELNPKEKETYQELVQQEPIMVRKFLTAADRYLEGKAEGNAEGKAEGEAKGLLNAIYKILQKQGKQIDDAQKSIFSHIQDTKLLDEMLEVSLTQNITVDQLLQLAQKQSPTP